MPSNLIVIGVNHDSAPVAVRERVAFAPESVPEAISALIGTTHLNEAIILSTCNRTEIYGWVGDDDPAIHGGDDVIEWLARYHNVALDDLATCTYRNYG
ncbi:MAG TPA: glutamyl-tRNA reductase, partial [Halieaceae bacterium]|nr:glutamyl-tRNA reductase [Halieaceae bacterium]